MMEFMIVLLLILNPFIGAIVLCSMDSDGRLFSWYTQAPSAFLKFLVLYFWFVVVIIVVFNRFARTR